MQSAQSALLLHEDTIRRNERERKTMLDQITALERQLLAMETDKKQIIVRLFAHFVPVENERTFLFSFYK